MRPAETAARRTRRRQLLCRLALAGALPACAGLPVARAQAPQVVHDDAGRRHVFDAPPQRIVSLLPSATELVWVLGAGARLVGVDRYSSWPAEVAALPRVGDLDHAQVELIARLKPDLVLAYSSARSLDKLESLGLPVLRLRSDSHADVQRALGLLARLLGSPDAAEAVWSRLQARMSAAAARVPVALRGLRVYFEIVGGPYAAGASSFIGETLARLGLANIVPAELGPFPKLNPEFVVRARPDIIMGVLREMPTLSGRPGWQGIPAVQQQRLCGFGEADYKLLTLPGPRLGEAAERLADCLAHLPDLPDLPDLPHPARPAPGR